MSDNCVFELHADLRKKLDHLCLMHNEPALHVDEHFADLKRQIDYQAEKLLDEFKPKRQKMERTEVNANRIEFIRILEEIENKMGLQTKPVTDSREVFASLEQRVNVFKNSSSSLDDLEEKYIQLALEIIDETDRVEERIFGEQTIIYCPHQDQDRLGSLVYFGDLFLGRCEIDYLMSKIFSKEDARYRQSRVNALLVPTREPFKHTKSKLAIESLSSDDLNKFVTTSKFFYIAETMDCYSAEGSSVDREFVKYQLPKPECEPMAREIVGFECSESFSNVCSTQYCSHMIKNARFCCMHAALLPSLLNRVISLQISGVHFESFDPSFFYGCMYIRHLSLQVTFSKDVKFELDFLGALTKLETLELTLPIDSPLDLSAIEAMTELKSLKLQNSAFFLAQKRPRLSKVVLKQILSAPCLETLELSCFDIEAIERDTFVNCDRLQMLVLKQNRLDDDSCMNLLRLPLCFENGQLFLNSRPTTSIKLTHCDLRTLSAASLAGMTRLRELSLTGNLIVDLLPGVFQDLHSLERLELDKNLIRHIKTGVFGKLNRLKTLRMDNNPIQTIDANAFAQLCKLESLSLEGCRLESIDSEMFNGLNCLKELNLCNNLIERIEVVAKDGRRINVAKVDLTYEEKDLVRDHLFKDLSQLSQLRLEENKLEKLDLNCFRNLKFLRELDLSSNKINELSGKLEKRLLLSLELLYLDGNQLAAINKSALPKNISELELSENQLQQLKDDFFSEFTQLKFLSLHQNKLRMTITEATFASCRRCLEEIDLSQNESIRVTGDEVFRFMPRLDRLAYDFSENFTSMSESKKIKIKSVTPEVIRALRKCHAVQPPRESQLTWDISDCSIRILTRKPDRKSEKELLETESFNLRWLPHASQLRELDVSKNLIEKLDDPELFTGFESNDGINLSDNRLSSIHRNIFKGLFRLETIDLSGNMLSSIDMGLFRHISKSLRYLNLSSNNISFLNLARLFRICPDLKALYLAENQLDDRSAAEPIDPKTCYHLEELVLVENRFKKMGFVRDMTCLQHLNLRGNQIETVMSNGENSLGRLLNLTHLDLSGNRINQLTDEMFVHLRCQLEHLDISGNPLDIQLDSIL